MAQCLSPIKIRNPDFGKKFGAYQFLSVPCGRCPVCLKNRQNDFYVRMKFELKRCSSSYFITLTYNPEHCPQSVSKRDLQLFFKRFRKSSNLKFKYYFISEYGPETLRPHYHGIFFFDSQVKQDDLYDFVLSSWNLGFIMLSPVNDARIKYVAGYFLSKMYVPDGYEKIFSLVSKGLGLNYVDTHMSYHQNVDFINRFNVPIYGVKYPIPRYYKDKIFTDSQKRDFARLCEERAEDKYNEELSKCRGSVFEVERDRFLLREFIRLQIIKHSKKLKL